METDLTVMHVWQDTAGISGHGLAAMYTSMWELANAARIPTACHEMHAASSNWGLRLLHGAGLPIGLQVMGAAFDEHRVLDVASKLQAAVGDRCRLPNKLHRLL